MSPLKLTCTPGSSVVPASRQPRLVYLLVEAGDGDGAGSLPLNLGLVIDVSESMHVRMVTEDQFAQLAKDGQVQEVLTDGVPAYQISTPSGRLAAHLPRRIDYVAEALLSVGEHLRSGDRFSLVAFAGEARVLAPRSPGAQKAQLQQAARQLEFLNLGEGTRLADGLALSLQQMSGLQKEGYASRMIVLTDGHTDDVQGCYAWARQASRSGISLTTMGIGSEFNEELLIPLADHTGGNAYYIESPEQVVASFRQELGSALRVSYTNVQVGLHLAAGVKLHRAHRLLPGLGSLEFTSQGERQVTCALGNHDPSASQALLLELVIPAWQAGAYRLAQASLTWDDPAAGAGRQQAQCDVVIQASAEGRETINERVLRFARKAAAFQAGLQALQSARQAGEGQGDRAAAIQRLRQQAASLLEMGEEALARAMLLQAERLKKGGADPAITKKLRYETRRLTQNLDG